MSATELDVQQLNDYQLLNYIGSGAYGHVYSAYRLSDPHKKHVALKILILRGNWDQTLQEQYFREFHHEALLMRYLRHNHIVSIIDFDYAHGYYYLVQDYVPGCDLQGLILRTEKLPLDLFFSIAFQLCWALEYLHAQNILHLDLKPANILLQPNGILKITDYGRARFLYQHKNQKNTLGTLKYCAPEQLASDKSLSVQADLFVLGIILYQLFTGKHPFPAENQIELIQQICSWTPPPVSQHIKGRTPQWKNVDLDHLIQQLLSKDVGERPENARQVRDQLWKIHQQKTWKPKDITSYSLKKTILTIENQRGKNDYIRIKL